MGKKTIIIIIVILIVSIGGYFLFKNKSVVVNDVQERISDQPDRSAEINGTIKEIIGNEVTVANEIGKPVLSDEEKAANKEARQNLTPEERTALREEEQQTFETEDVSIVIPVGIPIIGGSGEATGEMVTIDIADLTKGTYVSVWITPENKVEYVKVKGING